MGKKSTICVVLIKFVCYQFVFKANNCSAIFHLHLTIFGKDKYMYNMHCTLHTIKGSMKLIIVLFKINGAYNLQHICIQQTKLKEQKIKKQKRRRETTEMKHYHYM